MTRSGERCAEATVISHGMPNSLQHVDRRLHDRRVGIGTHQNQNGQMSDMSSALTASSAFRADVAAVLHAVERDLRHARVGARRSRPRYVAPRPTTVSTRPPAVDDARPSRRSARARVKHEHVRSARAAASSPRSARPTRTGRRIARRREHDADVSLALKRDGAGRAARRRPRRRDAARDRPSISGMTTCASGSPNRTLNSMTFGPSHVSIRPA